MLAMIFTLPPVTVIDLPNVSPLVIDLNGDGVHTTSLSNGTGQFDLLNNGQAIDSGWLSAGDGFLAIDLNHNGRIDNRSEMFGGTIGEGFARLATFNRNVDGKVDVSDQQFSELLI
jgi:hypothetical protein